MASSPSESPLSPLLEPSKEVSRAHLAAALLDYDAPEHSGGPFSSDSAATRSAILSPFRHLFVPQNDPTTEPEEEGYFAAVDVAESQLRPGTYSAGGRASPMFGGGSSERGSVDLLANRKSMAPSLMGWEDEEQDSEAEERLANEWGLGELMTQLGSGSVPTTPIGGATTLLPFPQGMLSEEEARTDAHETRSMPDLDRPRALYTASLLEPSTSSANGEGEDSPLTRRIRILERRGSASRARTQSLSDALELPSFGDLPSFAESTDITSRRPSFTLDPLSSSNVATSRNSSYSTSPQPLANRQSLFSLGDRTTADEPNPRVSSSFARPRASTTASRPISRLSLAPSTTLDPPSRGDPADDADDSRPLSSLSMRPTTPATFTSRFDPAFLAAQRQEIEKERPVFVNKDAGAPPAVVLMPAPLAGRPRSPPPKLRKEGPESEGEEEEEETLNDDEALASQRPAGALYGRSLMDVMAERQNLQKSRARHYVSGQDGRRSMMDWGDSVAGQTLLAAQGLAVEGGAEGEPTELGAARRSKSTMSIFGPDLVYQRDMERLKVIEAEEAKEREAQEERERIVWEKEREKQEKKRSGKGKLLKAGRPSGEFPREGGSDAARSPPTSPHQPNSPPRRQGGGHSALVPSISLPSGLTDPAHLSSSSWFPAPASSKAPSSTSSDNEDDNYRPPPLPSRTPLTPSSLRPLKKTAEQEKTSAEHSERLRRAVMMGHMTPSQAADESLLLGLGSGSGSRSTSSDTRPLGERCNQATYAGAGEAPPLLRLDLGLAEDEDGWRITDRERGQIREVRGDRLPTPPSASGPTDSSAGAAANDEDEEDDIPLAVRASMLPSFRRSPSHVGEAPTFDEEDDVPLGVRASMLPPFQRDDEDEDDRPLGYAAMGHNSFQQQQQQQQQFYLQQQQQQQSQAALFQQQQFAMAIAQQQSYNHYAASEMGSIGGGGGGMVEKWRRGVES